MLARSQRGGFSHNNYRMMEDIWKSICWPCGQNVLPRRGPSHGVSWPTCRIRAHAALAVSHVPSRPQRISFCEFSIGVILGAECIRGAYSGAQISQFLKASLPSDGRAVYVWQRCDRRSPIQQTCNSAHRSRHSLMRRAGVPPTARETRLAIQTMPGPPGPGLRRDTLLRH